MEGVFEGTPGTPVLSTSSAPPTEEPWVWRTFAVTVSLPCHTALKPRGWAAPTRAQEPLNSADLPVDSLPQLHS